jgi:hypothetical protein
MAATSQVVLLLLLLPHLKTAIYRLHGGRGHHAGPDGLRKAAVSGPPMNLCRSSSASNQH